MLSSGIRNIICLMKNFQNKKRGFTLIELIIVMAILVILAGILVPLTIGYVNDAQEAAIRTELEIVARDAQSAYVSAYAKYGLADEPYMMYSTKLAYKHQPHVAFGEYLRKYIGNDEEFGNIISVSVMENGDVYINYTKDGTKYAYQKVDGVVTVQSY